MLGKGSIDQQGVPFERADTPTHVPVDEEAVEGVVRIGEVHAQHRFEVVAIWVP